MAKKTTLNDLAQMMEKGFAAAKDDIAALERELKDDITVIEKKLTDRIDGLKVKVEGVQNTIDAQTLARQDENLPDRMTRVEKHLGLDKKIAAEAPPPRRRARRKAFGPSQFALGSSRNFRLISSPIALDFFTLSSSRMFRTMRHCSGVIVSRSST